MKLKLAYILVMLWLTNALTIGVVLYYAGYGIGGGIVLGLLWPFLFPAFILAKSLL